MEKIKTSAIAGTFYPAERESLKELISKLNFNPPTPSNFKTKAVIIPHAGLIYSGSLAKAGISLLDKNIKNIFIFAPSHRAYFEGISLLDFDFFETPLGKIPINKEISKEIEEKFGAKFYNEAFSLEHSIEVELPLLQSIFEDFNVIPILIGRENPDKIANIIEHYFKRDDFGFIISSDLSHFYTNEEAKKIDFTTASLIENLQTENFINDRACGAIGILGLMKFAKKAGFSLIRRGVLNSFDTSDTNPKRVVGYGVWALYSKNRAEYIKEYYSDFTINFCHKIIEGNLENFDFDPVFEQKGASFVTLEENGSLRGCIGSIIAHKPLIEDLFSNAKNAAYNDPRFMPVSKDEFSKLKIAVSILSEPSLIKFLSEEDLISQLRQGFDGVIIQDNGKRAVYLPSVWKQIPDKREFLNSLKVKAGMAPNYFSKTFEAYRFETVYIN